MAPPYVLAHNPGPSPVVVDELGRSLGGGEWGAVIRGELLDVAANAGRVNVVTKIEEQGAGDNVLAAYHQAAAWNDAAEKWAAVTDDTVRAAAKAHVDAGALTLAAGDSDTPRDHLVDLLIRADAPIPATRAKRPAPTEE